MAAIQKHITRRSAMSIIAGAAAGVAAPAVARRSPKKLNFLFILADDLGYADLSCYGRPDYKTPALDRLAAQGMRLTSAYANSSVCTATRVGLITGRYQYRLPVGLEEPLGSRPVGLPPLHPTIASLLRGAGYRTSLIGKWHMGNLPDYGPQQSGYDEFWGLRKGGVDYFTHNYNGEPDLWDGPTQIKRTGYLTDLLADRTIESTERFGNSDKPWLISLHLTAPHWPWEDPENDDESRRLAKSTDARRLMHYDGGTMEIYAKMVANMDANIGRVLAALKKQGQDRDTVVVFTSDNGGERFSTNWPFSGRKTDLLEGGIRVPAIVRWPGLAKAGSISDVPVMSMDWLPTFVAASGGALDANYAPDGIDIRNAIAGGTLPERSLYWRYRHNNQAALRKGSMKYLKINNNSFLFDLSIDPMERANLKARRPQLFKAMEAEWLDWNKTMLPFDPESMSHGFTADVMVDYMGVEK